MLEDCCTFGAIQFPTLGSIITAIKLMPQNVYLQCFRRGWITCPLGQRSFELEQDAQNCHIICPSQVLLDCIYCVLFKTNYEIEF